MSTTEDQLINEYQITLISVKMKVKFPCKMKLQSQSNNLTEQTPINEQNKFMFNKEILIKGDNLNQHFDIDIVLITDRGARYVSGLIKLDLLQLQKSEGQIIIYPLTKCLDNEAFCQIKVNKFKTTKLKKRVSVTSTLIDLRKELNLEKNQKNQKYLIQKKYIPEQSYLSPKVRRSDIIETKSEIGLKAKSPKYTTEWQDNKSKAPAQTLIYRSSFLKSPNNKRTLQLGSPKLLNQFHQQNDQNSPHDKFSQSQVYREGYQKLKQKYKKQSQQLKSEQNKRIQLQANENSYKIEIMRLKLKVEEQERNLTQKNDKIKDLQITVSEIQKQDLNLQCLKEENNNLEHMISQLNDNVSALNRQIQSLKKLNSDNSRSKQSIISVLREQLEQTKSSIITLNLQLSSKTKQSAIQISILRQEIQLKESLIELQKNQIYKLQSQAESKLFDFEKTLQNQKNVSNEKLNELRQKLNLLDREKKQVVNENNQLKLEKEKVNEIILKAEYDIKILLQEQKTIRGQLLQFKSLKQRHTELQKQLTFLKDDKLALQKQLQSLNQQKDINIQQITQQHETQLVYYKKQVKELQQKFKKVSSEKIQIESQLQLSLHNVDKQRRNIEALNDQVNELHGVEKELKGYIQNLEKSNLNLQNQCSILNNKIKFSEQTAKNQVDKLKELLDKNKILIQALNTKANQLYDSKSQLEIQFSKTKIQLQYAEQKSEKLFVTHKQLQTTYQNQVKQHQQQNIEFNQIIMKRQNQIKLLQTNLSKQELNNLEYVSQNDKLKKQLKLLQEKYNILENQLKSKIDELNQNEHKYKILQSINQNLQSEITNQKHQNNVLFNEKNKIEKILKIKNQQIQTNKVNYQKLKEENQKLQKIQTDLREEIKRLNQNIVKLQTKLKYTEKQFNKFKQQLIRTIKTEYSKIPSIGVVLNNQKDKEKQKQKQKDIEITSIMKINSNTSKDSQNNNNINGDSKKQLTTGTSLSPLDLISQLTTQINTSKQTTFKLIQHNKHLKKQLQRLHETHLTQSQKHIISESELQKDIQQLAQQLNELYNEKKQEIMNYDFELQELNRKLYDREQLIVELNKECEELEYVIATLKQDFQVNNVQNDKKVNLLKVTIYQLEEKVEYSKNSLSSLEDQKLELEQKYQLTKTEKEQQSQNLVKTRASVENITHQKQKLQSENRQLLRERKQLLQRRNELEYQFNESKQLKQKTNKLLQEQQRKCIELKQFINNLIKQKQSIIKSELEKSDQILTLQTRQLELRRDLSMTEEENKKYKSQLEELKDRLRKETGIVKAHQNELVDLRNKLKKVTEKSEEKEKQIILKNEVITKLDEKYRELAEKNYKQSQHLHNEIDSKNVQNINLMKQLNSKIILLQARIQQGEHIKAKQHHEYILVSEQLLSRNQEYEQLRRDKLNIEGILQELREQFRTMELRNSELNELIENRQDQIQMLTNKISELQGQMQHLQRSNQQKLEQLDHTWLRKYQILIEEQEQKSAILLNQNQMIRSQLEERINEIDSLFKENKSNEIGLLEIKNNYEEKIKKIENEKLTNILHKNNQIKKLNEENKLINHNLHILEESRKENSELLENIRKRLMNQEKLRKDLEDKFKTQKKLYEHEIETWRKKQSDHKIQTEKLYQSIFTNQREVRRVVQNYLKKVLDECDNVHIDKITNISRGLQSSVINAMKCNMSTTVIVNKTEA